MIKSPFRRIMPLLLLILISVVASEVGSAQQASSSTREPLFTSLWAEDPILGMEETTREARLLQEHLNAFLGDRLAGNGYSTVQVDVFSTFDALKRAFENGRHLLIQGDPALTFASKYVASGEEPLPFTYEPVLQFTEPRTGIILSMKNKGLRGLSDLNGAVVAAVHPYCSAGGLYQKGFLNKIGITPGLDFEIHYSGFPSEAVKMLVSGWVDAALVPEGTEAELLEHVGLERSTLKRFTTLGEVRNIPGDVFLMKSRRDVFGCDIEEALVQGLLAYYGNQVVETKSSYYITLDNLVESSMER